MKTLLFLCVSLLLVGCGNSRSHVKDNNLPDDISKAQQEVVCRGHYGVYEYGVNNYLTCNDGYRILSKDTFNITGPEVYDELLRLRVNNNSSSNR